jgi:hypothetical protein
MEELVAPQLPIPEIPNSEFGRRVGNLSFKVIFFSDFR